MTKYQIHTIVNGQGISPVYADTFPQALAALADKLGTYLGEMDAESRKLAELLRDRAWTRDPAEVAPYRIEELIYREGSWSMGYNRKHTDSEWTRVRHFVITQIFDS